MDTKDHEKLTEHCDDMQEIIAGLPRREDDGEFSDQAIDLTRMLNDFRDSIDTAIGIPVVKRLEDDKGLPISQLKIGTVRIDGKRYKVLHADCIDGNEVIKEGDYIYIPDEDRIKEVSHRLVMEDISHGVLILRPIH